MFNRVRIKRLEERIARLEIIVGSVERASNLIIYDETSIRGKGQVHENFRRYLSTGGMSMYLGYSRDCNQVYQVYSVSDILLALLKKLGLKAVTDCKSQKTVPPDKSYKGLSIEKAKNETKTR